MTNSWTIRQSGSNPDRPIVTQGKSKKEIVIRLIIGQRNLWLAFWVEGEKIKNFEFQTNSLGQLL